MRLIRLCLALIVALCGAILAIHLIGGLYPNPIAVLFTNPDGSPCQMPCLFGVRPGVTTLEDAFRLLDKHPLTHGMDNGTTKAIAFLYSKEVWINLSITSDRLIVGMYLTYNVGSCPLCPALPVSSNRTPELAHVMQYAMPGNQTLYFLAQPNPGGGTIALNQKIRPPSIFSRCYVSQAMCFYNLRVQNSPPEPTEAFDFLYVFPHLSG